MGMQNTPVLEIDELVLPATPDADDSGATHRPSLGGLEAPPQRRVMNLDIRDATTDDVLPQDHHGALDLR
jgi:hypothetical protein